MSYNTFWSYHLVEEAKQALGGFGARSTMGSSPHATSPAPALWGEPLTPTWELSGSWSVFGKFEKFCLNVNLIGTS